MDGWNNENGNGNEPSDDTANKLSRVIQGEN
jgi:hypothetical protein